MQLSVERADFTAFVTRHQVDLLRFAMVLCGNRTRAEDLVADALGSAFERWGRIGALENPFGYVRRMVLNDYLAGHRRNVLWLRRRAVLAPDPTLADSAGSSDERATMLARIGQLPPQQRSVVVMRYYLDLTDDQIAEELGCRRATVRSHAARALATLRVDVLDDNAREATDGH